MNVFILNSGRCGSTTLTKACSHIRNYTSAHESRTPAIGSERFNYPQDHIEIDNRLSWYLGRLDERYGNDAYYVHLKRDDDNATALSYAKRTFPGSLMMAYRAGIMFNNVNNPLHIPFKKNINMTEVAMDMIYTINSNIDHFLKDKENKMDF